MPSQRSASACVAFRVARFCRAAPDAPALHTLPVQRGTSGQMCGMLSAVGIMHLEVDGLAALKVRDQVEPPSLDLCWQERPFQHQSSPGRVAMCVVGGRNVRGGWARLPRFIFVHLAMRT
jgi:hypothetical protein